MDLHSYLINLYREYYPENSEIMKSLEATCLNFGCWWNELFINLSSKVVGPWLGDDGDEFWWSNGIFINPCNRFNGRVKVWIVGVGDTDSTIVPQAPCFYGCNDPLAGNYDPDATCSSFPHCRNHPDCGNCMYYTTAPEPEQDEERPEKPEVSLVRPEKPETSPTEPVSGETKTKIKKYSIDYVPDSETPIDKSLMEEIERIKKLLL